ncbi:MAG: hypothetical protein EAZ99_18890 [Alphaproteobacteria bacterium]|nr:hypothetical protein [Alphaproteobacteria bacterium]TAD87072.1 MAG: hypothetical protein EAZ99_18890 [Alphaproteobacteria bacterium]
MERERLAKLLGLLASDQEGEVQAAARAITRLVRDSGLSWDDLLLAPKPHRWTEVIGFPALYTSELRRRMEAERQMAWWRQVAEGQRHTIEALKSRLEAASPPVPDATAPRAACVETGNRQIDGLLAAELSEDQRIRVEAIASWFRRTGTLTRTEQEDLDRFSEQLSVAA